MSNLQIHDKGFYFLCLGIIKSAVKEKDVQFLKSEYADALCDVANLNREAILDNTANPRKKQGITKGKPVGFKLVKFKGEDLERLKKILDPSGIDDLYDKLHDREVGRHVRKAHGSR